MVNKALAVVGLIIATSLQLAFAHPGEVHVPLPRAELERRRLEAEKRTTLARRCAPQIAEFNAKRRAKRSVVVGPRTFKQRFDRRQDGITTPHVPTFAAIQNSTCVTAPEVTEGPYYVANELLRTDVREGQAGVELTLDIGVMDTRTCTPLADALVEIWACNAVGAYSGFTTAVLGASGNPMSDQNTWLRGGFATNAEGVVEFKTIYPGYYSGRTIHVHTMVQTNYSVATNGSILSHAGQVRHVGQIYFNEDLNNQVVTQPAYLDTRHTRTLNENDGLLASGSANGYNAVAASQLLGANIANGVLAYITVGVDTAFQGMIRTNNYVTPSAGGGAGAPGATAGASNGARALRPPLLKYFF